MAITLTGHKYTGTLSAVGTTTLTDSGASFSSGDFAVPRMAYLYRSGDPIGIARVNSYSSATVLNLATPFFDYDGDEVTQVSGDTYYISQTASEVATTGWAVSGKEITITDKVYFGTSGSKTGLFLHMEDYYIKYTLALANATDALAFQGGFVTFGNPLDLKNRVIGSECRIHSSNNSAEGEFIQIINSAASMMHFGTMFSGAGHTVRVGGGNGTTRTNGFWHVYVNCVCDAVDIVAAAASGTNTWPARASFQRVINLTSSGAGNNFMNVRWIDGYVEGGGYRGSGNALAATGVASSGAGFTGSLGALAGKRLRILDHPLGIFRASNDAYTNVLNCYNVLIPEAIKLMIKGTYSSNSYNTTGTLNMYWREQYTGLTNGTKYVVKDNVPSTVTSGTIGAGGDVELELLYQTRTFPTGSTTSDTFYNPWEVGFYQYGKQIIYLTPDVFNDTQAGKTVKNIVFGGPQAQSTDLLITEATKATVDAYTSLETAQKAYDRSCAETEDAYDAEQTLPIGRVGDQLDFDSGTATAIVYNSAAVAVWDYTGTTLTFDHTSDYTGGCTGTGTFTIAGAYSLNGGTFDNSGGVVHTSSARSVTGVTTTGEYRADIADTFTFTNCTIDTIRSTQGASTIINAVNCTFTNNPDGVTINNSVTLTVTGCQTGSTVRIENASTGALISEGTESGGTYTDTYNFGGNLSVKRIVRKYGYKTDESLGTITASGFNSAANQIADSFNVATEAAALAYTGITEDFSAGTVTLATNHTIQEIYDYLSAKAAVLSNLQYDTMISTINGVTRTGTFAFTVNTGISLNATGSTTEILDIGSNALTLSGTGTYADEVIIIHSGGTNKTIVISGMANGRTYRIEKQSDQSLVYEGTATGASVSIKHLHTSDIASKLITGQYDYSRYDTLFTIDDSKQTLQSINVLQGFTAVAEGTAAAYTGITLNFATTTGSLSTSHTIQEIYDYHSYQQAQLSNLTYDPMITTTTGLNVMFDVDFTVGAGGTLTSATQTVELDDNTMTTTASGTITANVAVTTGGQLILADIDDLSGTMTMTGTGDWEIGSQGTAPSGSAGASNTIQITGAAPASTFDFSTFTFDSSTVLENSSGVAVTVNLLPGATQPTKLETSGTITFSANASVTASSLINDTRVRLYNVTKAAELDNSVVSGGGGYSYTADTATAGVDVGDTLRLDHIYVSGTTCKQRETLSAVLTATGLSYSTTQDDCTVYNGNAIDGSSVTEYATDYLNVQVDIDDPDNTTTVQRLYAWYTYIESTEDGIRNFFRGLTAEDSINYRINTAIVDIKLDNVDAVNAVIFTGGRLYADDGTSVVASGSGNIQLEPGKAYLADSGTITTSLAALETKAQADTRQSALIAEHDATQATLATLATSAALATVDANVDSILTIAQLINKYHDNNTKFFDSDGTTEVIQSLAYSMVVYDDDGTTPLKTILFKDSGGVATTLSLATRYEQ